VSGVGNVGSSVFGVGIVDPALVLLRMLESGKTLVSFGLARQFDDRVPIPKL